MMIALIDDRDPDIRPGQTMDRRQAAEAGAHDQHMMRHGCAPGISAPPAPAPAAAGGVAVTTA